MQTIIYIRNYTVVNGVGADAFLSTKTCLSGKTPTTKEIVYSLIFFFYLKE